MDDPGGFLSGVWRGITDPIVEDWRAGNPGEAIGRGLFGVAELLVGGKGLTRLRRGADAGPGGAGPVRVGQAGEDGVRAVYSIGPKVQMRVNGCTRIPDGLPATTLSEVKNVSSLSYTQQLRDFADHAGKNGLTFDLYVRPTTQLSGPLQDAIRQGTINLKFIP